VEVAAAVEVTMTKIATREVEILAREEEAEIEEEEEIEDEEMWTIQTPSASTATDSVTGRVIAPERGTRVNATTAVNSGIKSETARRGRQDPIAAAAAAGVAVQEGEAIPEVQEDPQENREAQDVAAAEAPVEAEAQPEVEDRARVKHHRDHALDLRAEVAAPQLTSRRRAVKAKVAAPVPARAPARALPPTKPDLTLSSRKMLFQYNNINHSKNRFTK